MILYQAVGIKKAALEARKWNVAWRMRSATLMTKLRNEQTELDKSQNRAGPYAARKRGGRTSTALACQI